MGLDPDPYTGKRRRSRAHGAAILNNGLVATTDLGYDLVRLWDYDLRRGLAPRQQITLTPGSGPRHLVEHSDGRIFVVTEYSLEVVTLTPQPNFTQPYTVSSVVSVAASAPGVVAAGIALSEDGGRVYVGIRGTNRIVTLAVRADGLEIVGDVPAGGNCPMYQVAVGEVLYVANLGSHSIAVFELDPVTGVPREVVRQVEVPSPSCLAGPLPATRVGAPAGRQRA